MSIQSEVERLSANVQSALDTIRQTGVSVPENATSDALPAAAASLANEKQDKLTGSQGQVVGFDAEGNAVAQEAPQTGLTQEQADERYLKLEGGTISGDLQVNGTSSRISGVGFGKITTDEGFGPTTLSGVVSDTPYQPIGFGILDDSGGVATGLAMSTDESSCNFIFIGGGITKTNDVHLPYLTPPNNYSAATKGYVDEKVATIDLPLAFGPQTVATSAWAANTTYSAQGYGYRASVPLSGVTADHIPDVTFAMADAVSGNLAPLADTYAGGIYIYAKEQPSATVNIASVVCTKGA